MHDSCSHASPLIPPHPQERLHQHRHDVILGLDAGTTSAKAVAVDGAGEILATAGSDPIAVRSTPDGGREQDPEEIWQALATAGRRAVESLRSGARVAALSVAAQSGSVWATNPSNAAGMQLMDVSTGTWSDELCRFAGIDPGQLSPIRESVTAAGELTVEAAAALALDAGTPVVMGGHDQACAALGLGVVEPGDLFMSTGTARVLTVITDWADVAALPPSLNLSPHVVPGCWTASENLGGLGAMLAETPPAGIRDAFETCALRVRRALEEAGELAPAGGELILVGGGTRFRELVEVIVDTIAGCIENCHRMGELAVEEVRRYLAGQPAINEVRPDMLDQIA